MKFLCGLLWVASFTGFNALAAHEAGPWFFTVSGDSRNCGDVVMPMIAEDSMKGHPEFYWHLGDFRSGYDIDEDIAHDTKRPQPVTKDEYHSIEWKDFIDNQIAPFGSLPVYLTIGNHEMKDHTREEYVSTFKPWLNGGKSDKAYYRWTRGMVDFITLDNASYDQFDIVQMAWFRKILAEDEKNPKLQTVVVGMHAALPESISYSHSMSESGTSVAVESGREVYKLLLDLRDKYGKNVYVLASHSHFFMEGTFNTDYWKSHGGVLPGWIVGTAGAVRYALPKGSSRAIQAVTHVYGYLLATVSGDGNIKFDFQYLNKDTVPSSLVHRFGKSLIDFCFDQNAINALPSSDEEKP